MKNGIILLCAGILMSLNTGCSMVGVMIGTAVDKPHTTYTPVEHFRDSLTTDRGAPATTILKRGKKVQVITADRETTSGRYMGIKVVDKENHLEIRRSQRVTRLIPVKEVKQLLLVDSADTGKTVGFLLGAAVDASIIVALANADFSMNMGVTR